MTKKCLSVLLCLAAACFFLCTSKSPTAPVTVNQLEIANSAVAGWTMSSVNADTFCTYPIDSFYNNAPGSIDGGAIPYDSAGCKEIAYQTLTGPGSEIYSSYAMDFVTVTKASAMFGISKSSQSSFTAVPGFDSSAAFAQSLTNGVKAYAHFNKFYIEITLIGFTDNSTALSTAGEFLGIFKGKIQ